jgi:hypothetical protein
MDELWMGFGDLALRFDPVAHAVRSPPNAVGRDGHDDLHAEVPIGARYVRLNPAYKSARHHTP